MSKLLLKDLLKVGDVIQSYSFGKFEVISIESWDKVTIKFLDTGYETITQASNVRRARIKDHSVSNKQPIYDSESGIIYDKYGKPLSKINKSGYYVTTYKGKQILAHRLAWYLHYGVFPIGELDHINSNRADNRIVNLREVTRQQNMLNRLKGTNNTSGIKGVSKFRDKWIVRISINGKYKSFGIYEDIELAELVASEVRAKYHDEFANDG